MGTQTTNYNLTKPGVDDFYDISVSNNNMDVIDLQMKNNADAAAAKIPNSLATAADQVPVSSGAGAWAVKTLAQIKTWLGLGAAAYAAIVNNLTTTATGSVLDASQGKALSDLISNLAGTGRTTETVKGNADAIIATNTKVPLNGQISGTDDFNNYTVTGLYKCISNSILNLPLANMGYGILNVQKPYNYGYYQQIYTNTSTGRTWLRCSADGITWTSWLEIITTTYIATGTGSPEGVLTAPVGTLYRRTDGSTTTTLYVKTSGTGNTGWTAK